MAARRAALAALLLLAVTPAVAAAEPSSPAASRSAAVERLDAGLPRRCGVCHLERAPTPAAGLIVFAPPKGGGEAGAAAMCFSCHNGIVDDRRRHLGSGRHHPASGKVSCGSCHTPHVREANVGPFMRFATGSFSWCSSCHPGRGRGAAGEHPAIAQEKGRTQDCGGCHAVHGALGDGLIRAGSADELCGPCHGENPSRAGRGPGMATHVIGKGGPSCLGCHGVHQTVGGKALLSKAAFEGRLCRQCHERNFSPGRNETNHPVTAGGTSCLSCHRIHNAEKQSARHGLLAVAWEGADEICRRCHAALAGTTSSDGPWNHPLGGSVTADKRSLGARLARSGAFFAPGGKMTCLSCHRAHAGRTGTPQLVTAQEALCLYCHAAQNSLDPAGAALGAHPVSVRPSKARIAAAFINAGGVTGQDGEIICTTCHRAHRGRPGTPGLVLPRESSSCLLCHSAEASVAATPHSTARAPGSAPIRGAAGLCNGCHGEHGWRLPLGEPREGETTIDRICLSCHGGTAEGTRPIATNHPVGVAPAPGKGSGGLPLYWSDGRRYRLGMITCATCHDPHRAGSDGLFLREGLGGATREQCLGCHRSQATVVGTRHDGTRAGGSTCSPCHAVHDPLAVASWPTVRGGGDRMAADLAGFCGGCHREQGAAAAKPVTERMHPASSRPGVKSVGCGACHDPHRWNPLDATDSGERTEGDARTSFLVQPAAGPAPLCAGCHAEEAMVAGTPHDLTERISAGRTVAFPDPQRHGICAVCHQVHVSQALTASRAQADAGPAGGKPGPAPDPCERCHVEGGMAAGSTVGRSGHPIGISPGQDFGPDLPLFGADGRRQPRGRIACATCHEPHRWEPPGGSGAASKAATSFLRIGADGYAPLCFPCHADKSMVVGTDHDLRVTAPESVNLAGESPEDSGVCGACHAVHRPSGRLALWNRHYGEGWDERSRICTGCHRVGNDQGARVPPRTQTHLVNYPGRGLVNRLFTPARAVKPGQKSIAMFAEDGSPAEQGYLSCASCHDVHRWESDVNSSGSGVPTEGDLANSFLRVPPAALDQTLCADCHGGSLLDYYRSYHVPKGK